MPFFHCCLRPPKILFLGGFCALGLVLSPPTWAYERIVSATGNASEIIADLGLADKLIAVDTTSTLPKAIMSKKTKIGYRRYLSAEGILSVRPDLLILAPDAGPAVVLRQIKAAGVNVFRISDDKSVDGVVGNIRLLAKKLGAQAAAVALIKKIRRQERTVKKYIAAYPRKPNIAFIMASNRLMGLGDKTAGDGMIRIVGGRNVFADDFNSVKPVSTEAIIATDMDLIIIASRGDKNLGSAKMENAVADYPRLALTQAAQKNCIFRIGTIESLGFGPSVTQAAEAIASQIKPCLKD